MPHHATLSQRLISLHWWLLIIIHFILVLLKWHGCADLLLFPAHQTCVTIRSGTHQCNVLLKQTEIKFDFQKCLKSNFNHRKTNLESVRRLFLSVNTTKSGYILIITTVLLFWFSHIIIFTCIIIMLVLDGMSVPVMIMMMRVVFLWKDT